MRSSFCFQSWHHYIEPAASHAVTKCQRVFSDSHLLSPWIIHLLHCSLQPSRKTLPQLTCTSHNYLSAYVFASNKLSFTHKLKHKSCKLPGYFVFMLLSFSPSHKSKCTPSLARSLSPLLSLSSSQSPEALWELAMSETLNTWKQNILFEPGHTDTSQ